MKMTLLLVGLGGAIGSMMRYLTTCFVVNRVTCLPAFWGTFAVNFIGCLIIGMVYGLSSRYDWLTPQWRIFLATGICGGYTTFSAFAYENVNLLQQENYAMSLIYIAASVIVCLFAAFLGTAITKIM
jgi:CrcB protein